MDEAVTIYALVDPRDGAVKYVGQTRWAPMRRLRGHVGGCGRERSAKARWLRELRDQGLRPTVRMLEVVGAGVADEAERRHIVEQRALSNGLTNGLHDKTSAAARDVVVSVRYMGVDDLHERAGRLRNDADERCENRRQRGA